MFSKEIWNKVMVIALIEDGYTVDDVKLMSIVDDDDVVDRLYDVYIRCLSIE